MSYYEYSSDRRGGCMESLSRCCRNVYVYPMDTRRLLYVAGGVAGVILVAVIWSTMTGSSANPPQTFDGKDVLLSTPLIIGCNFFPSNLKALIHNNISKVNFDQNLQNDSTFGSSNCKSCQTDLARLQSGLVGTQVWSVKVPCASLYKDAVSQTLESIDAVTRLLARYPKIVDSVRSSNDIGLLFKSHQIGNILALSSGHSIDGRLPVLRILRTLGVRVMAITSDCDNVWAKPFSVNGTNDAGLSDFGKAMVREMNRLGILIDLSESSYKTQLDVLNITKAPVIFSHAAAFNLTSNLRNIKDDVLKKLKENSGVIMVTFVEEYITTNTSNNTFLNLIDHINYIKNIVGVDGIGIGAEFDADNKTYPSQLNDVSTFPALFTELGKTWTNPVDLKKLAGNNLLRVLEEVEKVAQESESFPADETFTLNFNSSCYSDFASRTINAPQHETTTQTTETTVTALSTLTNTTIANLTSTPETNSTTPISSTQPTNTTGTTIKKPEANPT